MNTCPVCGYDQLEFPPTNFSICACCGTEFGYDDRVLSHQELTQEWIDAGCKWFDQGEPQPPQWNAYEQLLRAKLIESDTNLDATASMKDIEVVASKVTILKPRIPHATLTSFRPLRESYNLA